MGHALGIIADTEAIEDDSGDDDDDDNDDIVGYKFSEGNYNPNMWTSHLADQNGNFARPGMEIITSAEFEERKLNEPDLNESDFFILDDLNDNEQHADKPSAGKAFFIGEHVSEVLDGAAFYGVNGLPVNGWENGYPELSHINTSGMMSHVSYSNYTSFLEAELAVMQDLGYSLDRRNYYGCSVYADGRNIINYSGYSARNADGTAYLENVYNTTPLGVGLHIYGSNNNVTQKGDILTAGSGAVGVRVDGVNNTLNIAQDTEVHADGKRGIGILVSYGNNHVVNQDGTVTANGDGGNGVQFDFGSSSNGALDEYRGSYIRYIRYVDENKDEDEPKEGKITNHSNASFNYSDSYYPDVSGELDGALIKEYNLKGTLSGSENAIYIGKNAFVENINILDGAKIKGDITSEWTHFDTDEDIYEGLQIQYNGKSYDYDKYIPDLATNLNFAANMTYDGNINGADNIKMNVNGGSLNYSGTADVISVKVGESAKLLGGTYKLNDMKNKTAYGFSDNETGSFYNYGIIGASTPVGGSTAMTIEGNLISAGAVQFTANGENTGTINVSGSFTDNGTKLVIDENGRYKPNYTYSPFVYEKDSPLFINYTNIGDGKDIYKTGMMSADYEYENGVLQFSIENNLGEIRGKQNETFNAMEAMYMNLDGERQNEMLSLYNLKAPEAKDALNDISSVNTAGTVNLAQKSKAAGRAAASRLNRLKDDTPAKSDNIWVLFAKDWGGIGNNTANYHSSAVTVGADLANSQHENNGVFFSYNDIGYASDNVSDDIEDYRLGVYHAFNKEAKSSYAYADIGWERGGLKRRLRHLDLNTSADTDGHLFEIGGEYKYDLHYSDGKIWHVSPYVNAQASYYEQQKYTESGAGVFNQHTKDLHNLYSAAEAGLELRRDFDKGSYAARIGCKNVFSGSEPEIKFNYEGDDRHIYTNRMEQDRHFITVGLNAELEFAPAWEISGGLDWQKGENDDALSANVMLRREW